MYSLRDSEQDFSFSSPPSSPAQCIDSSPPSSPGRDSVYLDNFDLNQAMRRAIDPLAASFNANRIPPLYEKDKRRERKISLPPLKKARHELSVPHLQKISQLDVDPVKIESEDDIWDNAVLQAMEQGSQNIDLINRQLTQMPKHFVADLEKVVILREIPKSSGTRDFVRTSSYSAVHKSREFTRVHTTPELGSLPSRNLSERSRSFGSGYLANGVDVNSPQIFLSNNSISKLPVELWNLQNLTILSLRQNLLTYLPPEIARLKNLHTLNVANNKLTFLPAEMNGMKPHLKVLSVHPNPFLEQPSSRNFEKLVSKTQLISRHRCPPLTEIALRALLKPLPCSLPFENLLSTRYELPLPEYYRRTIPSQIRRVLETCVPGSVFTEGMSTEFKEDDTHRFTGVGECPNPAHEEKNHAKSYFIQHAEQRFTWVTTIADVSTGGNVPLRWRGCQYGCLDFLEDDETPAQVIYLDGRGSEEDMDQEEHEVVQTLQLGSSFEGGLTFDD